MKVFHYEFNSRTGLMGVMRSRASTAERDDVTRRVGSQKKKKVAKSFQTPPASLPVCFCWGKKLPVVRSCGCSVSVASSGLFKRRECELLAAVKPESELSSVGHSAVRPLAGSRKSRRPSPFHLCRLVSQRASSAAS